MEIEDSFKTYQKNEMICPYEKLVIGVGRAIPLNRVLPLNNHQQYFEDNFKTHSAAGSMGKLSK